MQRVVDGARADRVSFADVATAARAIASGLKEESDQLFAMNMAALRAEVVEAEGLEAEGATAAQGSEGGATAEAPAVAALDSSEAGEVRDTSAASMGRNTPQASEVSPLAEAEAGDGRDGGGDGGSDGGEMTLGGSAVSDWSPSHAAISTADEAMPILLQAATRLLRAEKKQVVRDNHLLVAARASEAGVEANGEACGEPRDEAFTDEAALMLEETASAIRQMKESDGLTNQSPEVVDAVAELKRLKALKARARRVEEEQQLLVDLSVLCNAVVQCDIRPPAQMVKLVRAIVDATRASGRAAELGRTGTGGGGAAGGADARRQEEAEAQARRQARRVRAALADALSRWEVS